jgi:hypothetical protein
MGTDERGRDGEIQQRNVHRFCSQDGGLTHSGRMRPLQLRREEPYFAELVPSFRHSRPSRNPNASASCSFRSGRQDHE